MVATVLWVENRGWPEFKTSGWSESSAGARGPFQFIPSTWFGRRTSVWLDVRNPASYGPHGMGTDGDGDGVRDPNNPRDAVEAAFKHHLGSAGKPVADDGYSGSSPEADFQTTVFHRRDTNLLYYAAKYNGRGAPTGTALKNFPRRENADYVIMAYWLLASNFDKGYIFGEGIIDAKTRGAMFKVGAGGGGTVGGGSFDACSGGGGTIGGKVVGNYAWPVDFTVYQKHPDYFTKPHHDYPASDIPVPTGTPVYSMLAGQVTKAPTGGKCGVGVVVDSGNGITITYCHGTDGGSVSGASVGSQVAAGQVIMHSGNTGHSSGPHLHVGIRINGENRCPQPLFRGMAAGSPPDITTLPNSGCTY
jgi:murein DD-endopeptidase MepM/ murein hydrolase activator NlpD